MRPTKKEKGKKRTPIELKRAALRAAVRAYVPACRCACRGREPERGEALRGEAENRVRQRELET